MDGFVQFEHTEACEYRAQYRACRQCWGSLPRDFVVPSSEDMCDYCLFWLVDFDDVEDGGDHCRPVRSGEVKCEVASCKCAATHEAWCAAHMIGT